MSSRQRSFLACELSQDTHSTTPIRRLLYNADDRQGLRPLTDEAKDYRIDSVMAGKKEERVAVEQMLTNEDALPFTGDSGVV